MEIFDIHILGCGSALPTMRHFPSAQVVNMRNKLFLVDCGEGVQLQMRKSRQKFTALNHIFISHLHGDHCFGLIGLVSTFSLLGRTAPLHVYAHADLENLLRPWLEYFCKGLTFQVEFHAIDPTKAAVIYDDRTVSVSTIPLHHRVPTCGFLFEEKPGLPHIRRDMIDYLEIPLCHINNIKLGADWVTSEGKVYKNHLLVTPGNPGRKYAYCSDTRYFEGLSKYVEGVDLLYHEATYASCDSKRAVEHFHATAAEAASVAKAAGVGHLLLGHFSARYNDENVLLQEACEIFPETTLAKEGLQVPVVARKPNSV